MQPRKGESPQDPRHALIGCLDAGQTGCLVGRAASGAIYRVYVMLGEVLAAHAQDDDGPMIARLLAAGHLDAEQHAQVVARIARGDLLAEVLFDVLPEPILMEVLFERFRENLFQFLVAREVADFLPMDAVFTDNIQVGHDTRALVDELLQLGTAVSLLLASLDVALGPGTATVTTPEESRIVALCASSPNLAGVLATSPWEPSRALALIARMVDAGMVTVPYAEVAATPWTPPAALEEDTADGPVAPVAVPALVAPAVVAPPVVAPAPVALTALEGPAAPNPVDDGVPEDDATETTLPPSTPRGMRWEEPVADDDLEAFQDYDGGRGDGSFVTERQLLDRVELGTAPVEELQASTETLIEMEDAEQAVKEGLKSAVSLNFSGPKLRDQDALNKIEVTSDVLATIARALEAAEGPGAGQARLQLLVEGTQVSFAPLFKGVELPADGRLPVALVLRNLRKRPAGEHRPLLNRALSDLIERALSAASESLDDAGLDEMLERIAGYQQRLGI